MKTKIYYLDEKTFEEAYEDYLFELQVEQWETEAKMFSYGAWEDNMEDIPFS